MQIRKEYWVEYAHRLKDHPRQCKYIHGHSGRVTITFSGAVDDETGMVKDFGDLKWVEEIVNKLDHALILQQYDPLIYVLVAFAEEMRAQDVEPAAQIVETNGPPTAENLCRWIQTGILRELAVRVPPGRGHPWLSLESVEFEETRGNTAVWRR